MASLLFVEKEGEFTKDGVSSSAQNRGRTLRFIPPSLRGDDVAGPDVPQEEEGEVKEEEEEEGKVAGTLEFWAGDYE